ncbi:hypothetical protein M0804_009871 [Polistes exclamans]|nr:hypothetical protein M0804_009871 [Polistes exclamans]
MTGSLTKLQRGLENKDRTLVAISTDQERDGMGLISASMHYLTSILAELQPTHSASSYFAIVEYVDEEQALKRRATARIKHAIVVQHPGGLRRLPMF